MGCTPPPTPIKEAPPVSAQPSRIHLKTITSLEDIMKQEESAKFDLNDLDIKVEPECTKIVVVRKMDFENKEAMPIQ